MATQKVFFDCDLGVDDAIALGLLLGAKNVELVGVASVCGNIYAETGAKNTLGLLEIAQRPEIPVGVGCRDFSDRKYRAEVPHIHGDDGVGNVGMDTTLQPCSEPGYQLLIDTVRKYPHQVDIVAVGPLTNLAKAMELDPQLPKLAKSLTVMGGAFWVGGNISADGEANIYNDVLAANRVFQGEWSGYIAPLDSTIKTNFDGSHRQVLTQADSKFANKLADIVDFYYKFYEQSLGFYGCALHDPLAVALAIGFVEEGEGVVSGQVTVDTDKATWGRTRLWQDGKLVEEYNGNRVAGKAGLSAPPESAGVWKVVTRAYTEFPNKLAEVICTLP